MDLFGPMNETPCLVTDIRYVVKNLHHECISDITR